MSPCRQHGTGLSPSFVLRESLSEHRSATFRLLFCSFVLNYIPMLDQNAILDPNDVHHNPVHRQADARIAPMDDHRVSLSHDRSGFVLQRRWGTLDEIEQTIAARLDVRAVLNVVRGP